MTNRPHAAALGAVLGLFLLTAGCVAEDASGAGDGLGGSHPSDVGEAGDSHVEGATSDAAAARGGADVGPGDLEDSSGRGADGSANTTDASSTQDGSAQDGQLSTDAGPRWGEDSVGGTGASDSAVAGGDGAVADAPVTEDAEGSPAAGQDGGVSDSDAPDTQALDVPPPDAQSPDMQSPDAQTPDALQQDVTGSDSATGGADTYGPPPTGPGQWLASAALLGHMTFGGTVENNDVVAGPTDTAFLCTSFQGLHAIDVSNPASLKSIASSKFSKGSPFAPKCHRVAAAKVDGTWRVWVTWRGDNHQPTSTVTELAYDTSGTPTLSEVSHVLSPDSSLEGLAWHADRLWVANHSKGVRVLGRAAGKLVPKGVIGDLKNAWDVAGLGGHVVVADGGAGLAVAQTSATPAVIGKLNLPGLAMRVVVDPGSQRAYVAGAEGGLSIASLAKPAQPQLLSSLALPSAAVDVTLAGTRAFVVGIDHAYAVDVSQPTMPSVLGAFRNKPTKYGPSYHVAVEAVGPHLLTVEWDGLSAWSFSSAPAAPAMVLNTRRVVLRGAVGSEVIRDIPVHNSGNRWLTLTSATFYPPVPGLTVTKLSKVIAPGATGMVRVRSLPQAAGVVSGKLYIKGDDPALPDVKVLVTGIGGAAGPVVPTVGVQTLNGKLWKSSSAAKKVLLISYFSTFCPMSWHTASTTHRTVAQTFKTADLVMMAASFPPKDIMLPMLPPDTAQQVTRFRDILELPFGVGLDTGSGKMALVPQQSFDTPAPVPIDVLIGRDGRVLRASPRFDTGGLMSDIKAALAESVP